MKCKLHKDCIRVKLTKQEYQALIQLMSLSHEYFMKKSIDAACKCSELAYYLFIQGSF